MTVQCCHFDSPGDYAWFPVLGDELEDDVAVNAALDSGGETIHIAQGQDCVVLPVECLERAFTEIMGAAMAGGRT